MSGPAAGSPRSREFAAGPTLPDGGPAPDRRAARGHRWRLLIRCALSAGLLAFLFTQVDLKGLLRIAAGARVDLLLVLLGLVLVDRFAAALRWYVLLRGINPVVNFGAVARLVFVSGFLGYFMPGNVGVELFRIYGLARTTSDTGLAVTSVLVERIFALFALILLVLAGFALHPELPRSIAIAVIIGLAGLFAGLAGLFEPRARRLSLAMLGPAWLARAQRGLRRVHGVLDEYRRQPGLMLLSLVLAVLFQLIRCITPAVGAAALGISIPLVFYVVIMPIVVFLTLLPISVAGFGVQEAGFVYLFGLAGMSAEGALLLSLLIHLFVVLALLPGAWLYLTRGL